MVIRENAQERWGGDLRRHRIFEELAGRTGATFAEGWKSADLKVAVGRGRSPLPIVDRIVGRLVRTPRLASSEQLNERLLDVSQRWTRPTAVAVYDDAEAQSNALGVPLARDRLDEVRQRRRRNLDAFDWHVVPTTSFATLVGLDLDRVIVGGNGTDVTRIRSEPWPDRPAVGLVSGAAPGRGIEALIEAVRRARTAVPGLRLLLWLVATSPASEAYLAGLRASVADDPEIELGTAPYGELGAQLGRATVLAIAHPPNDYMDVALPVKLFDCLAAGRPILVTPRLETAALVRRHGVGVVTPGDSIDDLAATIVSIVHDDERARALGARAREVAEHEFDWRIVGARIADAVLARVGDRP